MKDKFVLLITAVAGVGGASWALFKGYRDGGNELLFGIFFTCLVLAYLAAIVLYKSRHRIL